MAEPWYVPGQTPISPPTGNHTLGWTLLAAGGIAVFIWADKNKQADALAGASRDRATLQSQRAANRAAPKCPNCGGRHAQPGECPAYDWEVARGGLQAAAFPEQASKPHQTGMFRTSSRAKRRRGMR